MDIFLLKNPLLLVRIDWSRINYFYVDGCSFWSFKTSNTITKLGKARVL